MVVFDLAKCVSRNLTSDERITINTNIMEKVGFIVRTGNVDGFESVVKAFIKDKDYFECVKERQDEFLTDLKKCLNDDYIDIHSNIDCSFLFKDETKKTEFFNHAMSVYAAFYLYNKRWHIDDFYVKVKKVV